MPIVPAHTLTPEEGSLQVYNGLDAAMTFEIDSTLNDIAKGDNLIYEFELALQAPALEMMQRGFRVDPRALEIATRNTKSKLEATQSVLYRLSQAVCDVDVNPNSGDQLKSLFYKNMNIPPVKKWTPKGMTEPMDRKVLEQLEAYFYARPLANAVLLCRDLSKTLQTLETDIDDDWRWRTSYNIAGTTTGRWSSSKSLQGVGGNLQNITDELRRIFIPDPGFKLCGRDLEQAESREVGWFCGTVLNDWSYLNMIEAGDPHTYVARLCWPELPWNGDIKKDRKIAERKFYRHFSYRDATKRLGHGCLTEDHEVLTPNGWVSITEKPTVIMQFENNESKFVNVINWIDKEWTGNFHTWEGLSLSACMTAPHRVYYTTTSDGKLNVKPVSNVPSSARIPNGWGFIGGSGDVTPEIARLIAAYQCDGYHNGHNQIIFHMRKDRKYVRLEDLCVAAVVEFKINRDAEKMTISHENVRNWPKEAGAYLFNWPIDSLKAYLNEMLYWDGSFGETSECLASKNREHLEWIQTCNRLIGIGGNIQKPQISGFGTTMYRLQYNNRLYASLTSIAKSVETKTARVLCPTVPSGAFYIRRKGCISVTGNSNYMGKPPTMSANTKIPITIVKPFQERYFDAFPCIPNMHRWIAREIQTKGYLITPFGRRRDFFDRTSTDETLRGAVAHYFQSSTGDRLNLALWRVWKHMGTRIQLLAQLHDAMYFQYREDDDEEEIMAQTKKLMEVELFHTFEDGTRRRFVIDSDAQVGYNWAHRFRLGEDGTVEDWNPKGLDKYKPKN